MGSRHYLFYERHASRLGRIASVAGIVFVATLSIAFLISLNTFTNDDRLILMADDGASQGGFEQSTLESP